MIDITKTKSYKEFKKKAEKRADDMPFVVPVNMTVDDFLAQWNSCHSKKEQYVRSKGQPNLRGK